MKTTLNLNITQEHIDKGEKRSCSFCPVALALKEVLPGYLGYTAGLTRLLVEKAGKLLSADTPCEVNKFMEAFDHFELVEPFQTEVTFVEEN